MTFNKRCFFILLACVCIIEKIVYVLSLGYINASLEMKLFNYYAQKRIETFLAEEKHQMEEALRE